MRHLLKYTWIPLVVAIYSFRLTLLPIFTDETNYLDWGWRAINMPGHIFYSLYDAKQPLVLWLFGISQNIFSDPLFAGRFVAILLGITTACGVYALAKKMFEEKTAVTSLILYLTSHYFFFFNRQALVEAGLAAIFIWTAYIVFVSPKLNIKKVVLLGILFGAGYLSKSNSLLAIAASLVVLLHKHRREIVNDFGRSLLFITTIFVVAILINLPMFLHPWFAKYIHLSTQYTWGLEELIKLPGKEWLDNLSATSSILVWFITPVTLLLTLWGIKKSKKFTLALWVFFPLVAQVIMAKFLVSRYLVAYLPALLIFAAYALVNIRARAVKIIFGIAVFVPNLYLIYLLYTSPPNYFLSLQKVTNYSYEGGYVTAEASGYNLVEARKYFDGLVQNEGPFILGIAVFSGNPEAGLLVYYRHHAQIKVTYLDAMLFGDNLTGIECLTFNQPVYLATRDPNGAGLMPYFNKHHTVTNNFNDSKIYVFKLKTDCVGKTLDLSLDM